MVIFFIPNVPMPVMIIDFKVWQLAACDEYLQIHSWWWIWSDDLTPCAAGMVLLFAYPGLIVQPCLYAPRFLSNEDWLTSEATEIPTPFFLLIFISLLILGASHLFIYFSSFETLYRAMAWYVVHAGRNTGVFPTWEACHEQISGFKSLL